MDIKHNSMSHTQSITTQSGSECTNLFLHCSGSGCEHHCLWQCPSSWSMEHDWGSCYGQSVLHLPRSLQGTHRGGTNTCLHFCLSKGLSALYWAWRL